MVYVNMVIAAVITSAVGLAVPGISTRVAEWRFQRRMRRTVCTITVADFEI